MLCLEGTEFIIYFSVELGTGENRLLRKGHI